ncbi:hypothetical protein RchiOBHm_Chr6g0276961 [Rosa chinensis]|uniref:Uncharacterized protein n=1 Tax=Rosa chinensis TaxID=74649 RepID=A0A2P6PSD6_ROSCH|nr:hypothetical protein RchiOBHm_Chr6g0276961 [Rosa chinensis]
MMYFTLLQPCQRIPTILYYKKMLLMAYIIENSISRIIQPLIALFLTSIFSLFLQFQYK